jgi:hypothetical protein
VKVTVVSEQGKEAVVAMLGTNDFFGEGCLAGQARRIATVATMTVHTDGPSVRAPITTRDDDSALCALRVSINTLDDGRGSMILACGDNEPMFA